MKFKLITFFLITFLIYCQDYSFAQCISGNCKFGIGTFVFGDGSKYSGSWKNSKPSGKGTYFEFDNTYRFEGTFINGIEHGLGKYIYRNGSTLTVYYPYDGGMKIVEGLWQKVYTKIRTEELNNIITEDKLGVDRKTTSDLFNYGDSDGQIKLISDNGVFNVEVNINGIIKLLFIIDSGASEVNIPEDVVRTLIRAKAIKTEDFLPGKTYVLADGSTVKSPRFYVQSLSIGGTTVHNVEASIGSKESSLLLGQSFLKKFSRWSIDNNSNVLTLVH